MVPETIRTCTATCLLAIFVIEAKAVLTMSTVAREVRMTATFFSAL